LTQELINRNNINIDNTIQDLISLFISLGIEKIDNNEIIIIKYIKILINNIDMLKDKRIIEYCIKVLDKIDLSYIDFETYSDILFYKSWLFYIKKDFSSVIGITTELINNGDKTYANYYNRGNAYRFTGNDDKAIKDFKIAIKLNPTKSEAVYNLGYIYYKKDNKNINNLKKAYSMNKSHTGFFYSLAKAYVSNNKIDEIDNLVSLYLKNRGGCPIGYLYIASIYVKIGNLDKALFFVNIIINNKNNFNERVYFESLKLRSSIYLKQNKNDLYEIDNKEINENNEKQSMKSFEELDTN
jgi:tetratricopeptide (TPR) repeat protein